MGLIARLTTWVDQQILTHTALNAEIDNIIDNLDPDGIIGASADQTAMNGVTDPHPGGTPSLATNVRGELQRLRYILKEMKKASKWYIGQDLVTKTGAYTATVDDKVILCDATGGAFSVTLPAATGNEDVRFIIKKTDASANAVTIDGNASETIDGATTKALALRYDSVIIVCDGTGWHIEAEMNLGVVTLTGTQTLTNKTLTTPTITIPVIASFASAPHNHLDAAGGGALGAAAVTTLELSPASYTAGTTYRVYDRSRIPDSNLMNESYWNPSPTSTWYLALKAKIEKGGTLRIFFNGMHDGGGTNRMKIYKNGVAHGTQRTTSTSYGAGWSEDLVFADGDTVEIWTWADGGGNTQYLKDFKLQTLERPAGWQSQLISVIGTYT